MTDTNTNIDMSSDDIKNLNQGNQQTLNDIKNLQMYEKELYDNLEQNSFNGKLTAEQKQNIVDKINQISQMRINLYDNLKNMYGFLQQNASTSRTTLNEQMIAIQIVENELNESKRKLKLLEDEKYNKIRLVEINTYYGKQYNAHTQIMKIIVYVCIPIIILSILVNRGLIPENIYNILTGLIIIIGLFFIVRKILDMINRDNMNYDEYDWYFNKGESPSQDTTVASSGSNPWTTPSMTCMGAACCYEGSTYDETQNICIPNVLQSTTTTSSTTTSTPTSTTTTDTSTDPVTESMVSNVFSKYAYNNNIQQKAQMKLKDVKPFTDSYTQFASF